MLFKLHSNFAKKDFILSLPLSTVLLENEAHYPWLILVPERPNIRLLPDLSPEDQRQLLQEVSWAHKVLIDLFHPDHINVAAIGNKTPQFHVHVIGRYRNDPSWPATVWDHPTRQPYSPQTKTELSQKMKDAFQRLSQ